VAPRKPRGMSYEEAAELKAEWGRRLAVMNAQYAAAHPPLPPRRRRRTVRAVQTGDTPGGGT
jgi:hypothetical protein